MAIGKTWDDSAIKWLVDKVKTLSKKTWLARQTLATDNNTRPLLMSARGSGDSVASSDDVVYRNNTIYANPSTGKITAKGYTLGVQAEIQYDATNKCINFVFN